MGQRHNRKRAQERHRKPKGNRSSVYSDPNATVVDQAQLLSNPDYLQHHPLAARFPNGQYPNTYGQGPSAFDGISSGGQSGASPADIISPHETPRLTNHSSRISVLDERRLSAEFCASPDILHTHAHQIRHPYWPSSTGYPENDSSHGSNGSFTAHQSASPVSNAHQISHESFHCSVHAQSTMPDMEPDYPSIPQRHTAPTQEDLEAEDDWSEEVNEMLRNGYDSCPRN